MRKGRGKEPHLPKQGDESVTLEWNALTNQFKCPVCLSILTNTMTFMECMHRFCAECISKSLRIKRECPSCRTPCPSRRSLRADKNFDKLIQTIYPNRDWLEAQQAQLMENLRAHHNMGAFTESVMDGMADQAKHRGLKPGPKPRGGFVSHSSSSSEEEEVDDDDDDYRVRPGRGRRRSSSTRGAKRRRTSTVAVNPDMGSAEAPTVEVLFIPHPDETTLPSLNRRYLRTSPDCTLAHLSKYLAINLNVIPVDSEDEEEGPHHYSLSVQTKNGYHTPPHSRSLEQLIGNGRSGSSPFTIYYASGDF